MMWQYAILGVILAAVVGIVVVRLLSLSKKGAVENPFCAGCALAKNCKRRSASVSECGDKQARCGKP